MTSDPFRVVRDFEAALCEYTGAPYAVTVNSCTMALLLAVAWHRTVFNRACLNVTSSDAAWAHSIGVHALREAFEISIPKRTYVGVPYAIREAGGMPTFRDEDWFGTYQLKPLPVWDSARWFTEELYYRVAKEILDDRMPSGFVCVSFHWSKTLGIQQGGAVLHDSPEADAWLRRSRFDGRTEGVAPKDDTNWPARAWHAYMSPEIAAEGLVRLSHLPLRNLPLPNSDYPDLSQIGCFK